MMEETKLSNLYPSNTFIRSQPNPVGIWMVTDAAIHYGEVVCVCLQTGRLDRIRETEKVTTCNVQISTL